MVNIFEKADTGKIDQVVDRTHRIGILINKKQKKQCKSIIIKFKSFKEFNFKENSLGPVIKIHVDLNKKKYMLVNKMYGSQILIQSYFVTQISTVDLNKLERC